MKAMQTDLPRAVTHGIETADIGFVGVGITYGVINEAMDILAERNIHSQFHQLRTIWPMLEETPEFTRRCRHVFVVEYNSTGQLATLIIAHGGEEAHIQSILAYDGMPLQAEGLVQEVIEFMSLREQN